MYLLRALIGSLDCLRLLWLVTVITLVLALRHSIENRSNPINQSELETNTCNLRQARENACRQVAIGLVFASDWSRKWREIFWPIAMRSNAKPKQTRNSFDTQLKIALRRHVLQPFPFSFPREVEQLRSNSNKGRRKQCRNFQIAIIYFTNKSKGL